MIIFSKEKLDLLIFFVVPETHKGLKCVSHVKFFCIFIFLSTILENPGCITLFCTIHFFPCKTTTIRVVSRFVERENARQRLWFSLPELR